MLPVVGKCSLVRCNVLHEALEAMSVTFNCGSKCAICKCGLLYACWRGDCLGGGGKYCAGRNSDERIGHVVKMYNCSVLCVRCLPFVFVFLPCFLCYRSVCILRRINNRSLTHGGLSSRRQVEPPQAAGATRPRHDSARHKRDAHSGDKPPKAKGHRGGGRRSRPASQSEATAATTAAAVAVGGAAAANAAESRGVKPAPPSGKETN